MSGGVLREGTTLDLLESADSRRYLPHALLATALVIVLPALVVVPLAPFSGVPDMLLSALLATGFSVVAGGVCSALWARRPESSEIVFGDLMLWAWARRVRAERRLAAEAGADEDDDASRLRATPDGDRGLGTLRRLSVVFEARDANTHGHSARVARHAAGIARQLGLPASDVGRIKDAAAVHDVGKLAMPRSIVTERRPLTDDERTLLERHAAEGADKVADVAGPELAAMVRHHHERVDGRGYPDGLVGDEIPLGARIIAVADAFDGLTRAGSHGAALNRANALDLLSRRTGTELDADVVTAFAGYYSGRRAIAGVALAATAPQRLARWLTAAPSLIGAGAAPVAQGICAAGALALTGACLTGLPAPSGSHGDGARASGPAAAATDQAAGDRVADTEGGTRRLADGRHGGAGGDRGDEAGRGEGRTGSGGDKPSPTGGDGLATTPVGGTAPQGGGNGGEAGGGGDGQPVETPGTPSLDLPQVDLPQAPSTPLDPVLDGVDQVLDPLPTQQLTDSVKKLLAPTGLTSAP